MKHTYLTLFITLALLTTLCAQEKKGGDIQRKKVEITRGQNPNIIRDEPSVDKEVPKPTLKSDRCLLTINNNTGYFIKVYLSGVSKGTLAPYETGSLTNYSEEILYCITIGATYEWSVWVGCSGEYNLN